MYNLNSIVSCHTKNITYGVYHKCFTIAHEEYVFGEISYFDLVGNKRCDQILSN